MKVLIVSGGKAPQEKLLNNEIDEDTVIIAVDSGANCLYRNNIVPHYLLGDFDSIDKDVYNGFTKSSTSIITFPTDKDYTDTQLAVEKALELKATHIVLLGCTGSRVDHLLGNLGLLKHCYEKNVIGIIKDENNSMFITDKDINIKGKVGTTFSVQAYCDEVVGLSLKGVQYPLENYNLKLGDPRTISNVFLQEEVQISFKKGILLIIYSAD